MHDRFHAIHAVSLKIFSFWNTGEHAFLWKSAHCRLPDFSNPGVCTKLFVWSEGREWSSVKSKNIIDGDDTTLRQIITKYSHFPFKSVCCFELLQANGFFLLFFCFSIHCRSRWDPLGFFFHFYQQNFVDLSSSYSSTRGASRFQIFLMLDVPSLPWV